MASASKSGRTLAAVALAGAFAALAGCSDKPEQLAVEGSAKAAKLEQCVEPTEFMRRNHMELIKHQREVTVREGIRATDDSLAGCVDCHVQFDSKHNAVPVNADGQFCSGCHSYVSVSLDCFQCHSPVPDQAESGDLALFSEMPVKHGLAMTGYTHDGIQEKGN
jgi:predicted CXXCH cytochrome family protein